jgi:1,4-alpha-glucan branching enzyme
MGRPRRDPGLDAIASGTCRDPHRVLGVHKEGGQIVVRTWRPGAATATLEGRAMRRVHDAGVFEVLLDAAPAPGYAVTFGWDGGGEHAVVDPWPFWPTLGDLDVHLIGEGRHDRLWTVLGAHPRTHQGTEGTAFAVWAPSARAVRVTGDWNGWDSRVHPMRAIGASGVWELFVP